MNRIHTPIPAVDLTPTGHALPYIPEQPSGHPENGAAQPGTVEGVDLGRRFQAGDPDAHLVSTVLVDGTVSLCADEIRLTTPADTREAARQAAAISSRLFELADQQDGAREHRGTKTVTVLIGLALSCSPGFPGIDVWGTPDAEERYGYGFDAVYDPQQLSLADAEAKVRSLLAEQGVTIGRFLNEDQAEPGASDCTVYEWCIETGPHTDHMGEGHDVPSREVRNP
jgi:hypothetical protein